MNLKLVFYLEIFINIITILLCFFAPAKFIDQLVTTEHSTFAYELARWYGVVLLIFSGIFLLALLHESFELLKIVLQVNLVGDVWVDLYDRHLLYSICFSCDRIAQTAIDGIQLRITF